MRSMISASLRRRSDKRSGWRSEGLLKSPSSGTADALVRLPLRKNPPPPNDRANHPAASDHPATAAGWFHVLNGQDAVGGIGFAATSIRVCRRAWRGIHLHLGEQQGAEMQIEFHFARGQTGHGRIIRALLAPTDVFPTKPRTSGPSSANSTATPCSWKPREQGV